MVHQLYATCSNGRRIYVDPQDTRATVLKRADGKVHPAAVRLWERIIERAERWDCVIDVGSNYGEMLVNVDALSKQRIIAVEPNPRTAPLLRRTLAEAGFDHSVIETVISDSEDGCILEIDLDWSGNTAVAGSLNGDRFSGLRLEPISVPSTTLSTLIAELNLPPKPHLAVKIDVEGHEMQALLGLEPSLNRLGECVLMVEIVRLTDSEIEWLLARFEVEALDLAADDLVPVSCTAPDEFRSLFVPDGRFYHRDAAFVAKASATTNEDENETARP